MSENRQNPEIERRIDSGLFACLILLIVVLEIAIQVFYGHSVTSDWAYYPCLFAGVCILAGILKRTRPSFRIAGKRWGCIYRFVLTQMDIESAFKRKKKGPQQDG
jgi:peptidoglycan/LPS O-acetylase OafA/YrhL